MTFDELVASLRQIDGQRDKGKHPPDFHFRSKPFLHFHLRRRPARPGLRGGHRINAEETVWLRPWPVVAVLRDRAIAASLPFLPADCWRLPAEPSRLP